MSTEIWTVEERFAELEAQCREARHQSERSEQRCCRAERRLRLLGAFAVATVLVAALLVPGPPAALAQGQNPVAQLLARIAAVETALANETAARQAADAALQAALNNETAARQTADSSEAAARAAADTTLQGNLAAVADKLVHFSRVGDEVFITHANLHLINGTVGTQTANGLGNLIIGYNAYRNDPGSENIRTGSHNLILGDQQNYASYGGIVAGQFNALLGPYASVTGGAGNTASGQVASVSGGKFNTASGDFASISGGDSNLASREAASISGGYGNTASGSAASVSGGGHNFASGLGASV